MFENHRRRKSIVILLHNTHRQINPGRGKFIVMVGIQEFFVSMTDLLALPHSIAAPIIQEHTSL